MANKLNSSSMRAFVNTGFSLLFLRLAAGGMLFYHHGLTKVLAVSGGHFPPQFDPIGLGPVLSFSLAAFAEGLCTLLVMVGFYTRLASLLLVINFVVAYYAAGKELALFYLVIYAAIFLIGPGKWSLDGQMNY